LKGTLSKVLKLLLLPILIAVYFPMLNYANNAALINFRSLIPIIVFSILLAIGSYLILLFFAKKQSYKISLAAFFSLAFFHTYGILFKLFNIQDIIEIRHSFFLPLILLIAIFTIYQIFRLGMENAHNIWQIAFIISVFLLVLNLIRIIPVEIRKFSRRNKFYSTVTVAENIKPDRPDIYFIIFDEFAGFEAMRDYWQNPDVDDFVSYLHGRGFFVAENSHSTNNTGDTLHQMAMRLNYQYYPAECDKEILYDAIVDNQAMQFLKEKGYQTITFDEIHSEFGYPARGPIRADINYEDDPSLETYDKVVVFDAFGKLVTDNSILSAVSGFDKISYSGFEEHKNMISFTVNEIGKIENETPIFVYVHLLFPHTPFMFDENGHYIGQEFHTNWDYYLGNYNFSMKLLQQTVDNILSNYSPEDQPVIILQSDHGARNSPSSNPDDAQLENFPEDYKALILNAIYLPYCNDAPLTQDMDPINIFPIIFNCLFDAEIPLN
jgi:hypothetical protein